MPDPRENYDFYFQLGLSITLIIFIVLFLGLKVDFSPYKPKKVEETILENIEEKLEDIELPKPPPKPKVVEIEEAEAEEEEEVQETIEETVGEAVEEFEIEIDPGQVFEEFQVEEPPELIKKVFPEYPDIARQLGLEGKAVVIVIVGPDGKVKRVERVWATHDVFKEPARKAALKCIFKPARQAGIAVSVRVRIPFHFYLK